MTMPLTDGERWSAVVSRDRRWAGTFVYAVRSTGVYCRAGCPSRRPGRGQVVFFPAPPAAEQAGFRPCRRCRPGEAPGPDPQVRLVERVCRALDAAPEAVTLTALAGRFGLSPAHLQRVFRRLTGVTPKGYFDARREGRLRRALRNGNTVSRALYEAGYGSPSRIYERTGITMGMTPATYRAGAAGQDLCYALADCQVGRVVVAATERGICFVGLGARDDGLLGALGAEFPSATRTRSPDLEPYLAEIVRRVRGEAPHRDLPLDIRATAFQRRVWEELQRIPPGRTVSYAGLARRIRRPTAVRAVAHACASNNVAVVIPCHRVVRSDGTLGGYRWGLERKQRLLEAEREARAITERVGRRALPVDPPAGRGG